MSDEGVTSADQLFGVAFPLSRDHIQRILKDRRLIYVKYPAKNVQSPKQKYRLPYGPGTKLLFYQSGGLKSIIGEAEIVEFKLMSREEIIRNHREDLFLSVDEFEEYTHKYPGRERKLLMIFVLKNPIIYDSPKRWPGKMTMVGQYLSEANYNQIVR